MSESSINMDNVLKFAIDAHYGQKRKNTGENYINHPLMVREMLQNWGVSDQNVLAAAMLHDVIEDTSYTSDDILLVSNQTVLDLVLELTLPDCDTKVMKALEISKFLNKSHTAILIKLADRICNIFDFICTLEPNAYSYYMKGTPIYLAFRRSQLGITELFGKEVFSNADYSLKMLYKLLDKYNYLFEECQMFSTAHFKLNRKNGRLDVAD